MYELKSNSKDTKNILKRRDDAFRFTQSEIDWMNTILRDWSEDEHPRISKSYIETQKLINNRLKNKFKNKKILESIRSNLPTFTLEEFYKMSRKTIIKFSVEGIYFIYNRDKSMYYIGQSINIYKRSIMHFQENRGNQNVFRDYIKGNTFEISLVPLTATPYNTVNELEDIAIISYDSVVSGYNDVSGHRNDRPFFDNEEYEEVSNLIINKVKDTKFFETVTNAKKRTKYIYAIFKRYNLKKDSNFIAEFKKEIQNFHRDYFR